MEVLTGAAAFSLSIFFLRHLQSNRERNRLLVSQLFIYPIKGCAGISVDSARIAKTGFEFDRIFLLVDKNNYFLSQRKYPKMALIKVKIDTLSDSLIVQAPNMKTSCRISLRYPNDPNLAKHKVSVWGNECETIDMGSEVNDWFNSCLGTDGVRLMRMHKEFIRKTDEKYAPKGQTAFADGYPFLILSEASMDEINRVAGSQGKITIERFRPNIVISGCPAFAEDSWEKVEFLGNAGPAVKMKVVKPCARCTVPNVDPVTGEMDGSHGVTKVLKLFRTGNDLKLANEKWKKEARS